MARKQITIPRGYDPADNDIGNYNQISGRNYEFWYAEIGEVRTVLGEDNYNLGKLCKSSSINKWAAFKPTSIEDQTLGSYDYTYNGMALDVEKNIVYAHKPSGGSGSPYCLDHFLGYHHNAREPKVYPEENVFMKDGSGTNEGDAIVGLPEWDIRIGVQNQSFDTLTIKSMCYTSGGESPDYTYYNEKTIEDTDIDKTLTSMAGKFTYKKHTANYNIELEVWFGQTGGNTDDLMQAKHPDFFHEVNAVYKTDPIAVAGPWWEKETNIYYETKLENDKGTWNAVDERFEMRVKVWYRDIGNPDNDYQIDSGTYRLHWQFVDLTDSGDQDIILGPDWVTAHVVIGYEATENIAVWLQDKV